jgi:phosphoserine phosphatase
MDLEWFISKHRQRIDTAETMVKAQRRHQYQIIVISWGASSLSQEFHHHHKYQHRHQNGI